MSTLQHLALILLLEFAVFKIAFSEEECQAEVVLTTKKDLKRHIKSEIYRAFENFTGLSTSPPATQSASETPIQQLLANLESKISNKLDSFNNRLDSLDNINSRLDSLDNINSRLNSLDNINSRLDSLEENVAGLHRLGHTPCNAASSCAEILQEDSGASSGYYWVKNVTGHPHSVHCNMSMSCKGESGGWMRVAYLDMTNSNHHCPSSLRQRTDSNVRSCAPLSDSPTCSSVWYRIRGILHSKVCGKVIAYGSDTLDGFSYTAAPRKNRIDGNFLDGVVLTHGTSHHIWTFLTHCSACGNAPSFIDDDYFCDELYTPGINLANPMWDGEGSNSCYRHNSPPWFLKQLSQPTTDDIQLRVCRDQERGDEDLAIKTYEIYVK